MYFKTKNIKSEWKNAKTFSNLCNIMKKSVEEYNFNYIKKIYDRIEIQDKNTLINDYVIKSSEDLIKLNDLNFLTTDSELGFHSYDEGMNKLEDYLAKVTNQIDITESTFKVSDCRIITDYREHIQGIINKDTLNKLLPKLHNMIVYIKPCKFKQENINITHNYEYNFEQNGTYIFIPDLDQNHNNSDLNKYIIDLKRTALVLKKNYDEYYSNMNIQYNIDKKLEISDKSYSHKPLYFNLFDEDLSNWIMQNCYIIKIFDCNFGSNNMIKNLIDILNNI